MYHILITVFLVGLFTKFYLKHSRIWKLLEHLPTPKGLPILGNTLDFAMHPSKILEKFQRDSTNLGGLLIYRMLWYRSVLISDYDHIEAILSTTRVLHKSEEYEYFRGWLGTGLLTSGPEKWKKTRKIITPTFHFQILEQFIDIFDSCASILVDILKTKANSSQVNIYDHVTLCALDVICETAMGTKVNAQLMSDSKYVRNVKEMSRVLRERLFSPVKMFNLFYYLTEDYKIEQEALKVLHEYTNSVIQKRRDELSKNNNSLTEKRKRLAFLDLLLQSTLDGRPMTNDEIRQEVDTFMFEGHDTTAFAISCGFYCLAKHPDVQQKVVEELKDIFYDDINRAVTYNDLQNMKYLEMVIKETLRLYPSVPFYGRKVVEDTRIGSSVIPADVSCIIFAWGLHRNPQLYPNPEKFDPERFTLENQNLRGPFSYIPFSAGPRNCIGQRFAMLEMKATISKVLRHFEILEVPEFEPVWLPDLILKPMKGIDVRLRQRNIF